MYKVLFKQFMLLSHSALSIVMQDLMSDLAIYKYKYYNIMFSYRTAMLSILPNQCSSGYEI